MIWNNWGDFFAMGGYGLYVWGSVLVVAFALLVEVLGVVWRGRAIRTELRLDHAVRQRARKGTP
ncbi:MAG: heme exporter protein CcmD [Rubrivivax sp.]|nr:MAG: heme exporter protein CcmD [Rubrivivax sp.]